MLIYLFVKVGQYESKILNKERLFFLNKKRVIFHYLNYTNVKIHALKFLTSMLHTNVISIFESYFFTKS